MVNDIRVKQRKFSDLRWWEVILVSIVVSAIGGLASGRSAKRNQKLYDDKLEQAPWAPPGSVFAPVWIINNFFLLLALQRLVKSTRRGKKRLMFLQMAIWAIFFSFTYVYFNKKSPVLAAVWTLSDVGLATASFVLAYRYDKKIAYHYLPLLAWTSFASTVAGYQALKNPDPLLKTRALLT